MQKKHWQDGVTFVLGLWAIVSPWTIEHVMVSPATPGGLTSAVMLDYYVVGLGVVIFAVGALITFKVWQEWVNVLLGTWLLVSPWLLGFSQSVTLLWNAVTVGALIVVFAGWVLWEEQDRQPLAG